MELATNPGQRRVEWGKALVVSAWLGSLAGMSLMLLVTAFLERALLADELWALPVIVVVYGTFFGLPVALLGLFLIGLPATLLLKPWAEQPWMPVLALLAGASAGRVAYHLVDHAVFFGIDDLWTWRLTDYGILIGASTGLIWFFQARRVLRNQRIDDAPPQPQAI